MLNAQTRHAGINTCIQTSPGLSPDRPLFLDAIIQLVHKRTAVVSRITVWAHVLCDVLANLLDLVLAQTVFDRTEAGIGEALLPVIPRGSRFATRHHDDFLSIRSGDIVQEAIIVAGDGSHDLFEFSAIVALLPVLWCDVDIACDHQEMVRNWHNTGGRLG